MVLTRGFAVAALLVNATTWGLAWWPIRLLSEAGLHTLWATALIYAIATAGILLVFRGAVGSLVRGGSGIWWLILSSGVTNACFNWAVTLADVARVALLFYLMPIWAALLARWLLKEPLTILVVGRIVLALSGAAFVLFDPARPAAGVPLYADLLAIAAGMGFAFNAVTLRRIAGQSRGAIALAMFGGGALLPFVVALLLAAGGLVLPFPQAPGGWMLIVVLTALAFLIGNLALQYGAARLPANTTSLIMLAEIAVAAASAALIAGETLSSRALIGGALIVAAASSALWASPAASTARVDRTLRKP